MKGREWKVEKDTHKNEKPFYSLVVKLNEEEWGEDILMPKGDIL